MLKLSIAVETYDRTQALVDGKVQPAGIELEFQQRKTAGPTTHRPFVAEIFQRMIENKEFDASELGLTYYLRTLNLDDPPFIAIPVFTARFFRHAAIFINTRSGIRSPQDLKGKRFGEPFSYGTDAGVWAKGILQDEYGVPPASLKHFIGGMNNPMPRWDWLPFNPFYKFDGSVQELAPGQTLDKMLDAGEIDALCSPVMPQSWLDGSANVRRLFEDYETVERAYFRKTGIYPILHTIVIRRDLYRKEPWIAQALYAAFKESKEIAMRGYRIGDGFMHNYYMVPWFAALRDENRRLMGEDVWPYGLAANRNAIDTFLRYHHEQGMSKRRYQPEEIFALETLND
ncbi:MAG: hypothetical protein QOF09_1283 [Alphaproteobacteria bacterium]|nr:hypothetical protein [Alphaproteobacteria bacterium]